MLPHRDTESGETLPVAEKVSRFRGSGTIDGTGQVASIVMPRRCRRALNAPLGRFFALLMPCSNLWIPKRTPPCWVVFFLSGGFNSDIFAFTSKSKPSAAGLVLEKATAEWVRGSFLKKVSESDMAFTATCNIATL